jgi:hypothetical protein
MISKNHRASAAQKRWHDDLAKMGCILGGGPAEIDHLGGASARVDNVRIGQWFVCPLSPYWHRLGPINRTSNRAGMALILSSRMARSARKGLEVELFVWACESYIQEYCSPLPFDIDVMSACLRYARG